MKKLLFLIFIFNASASAAELPNCEITKSAHVSYSSAVSNDVVEVTISGAPCDKAKISITIRSKFGLLLYSYKDEFKKHTATQWDDPELDEDALRVANDMISNDNFIESKELLGYKQDPLIGWDYQNIFVSKELYESIKNGNYIIYRHPTSYESSRFVVYMKKNKQSVVLSEVGL